ncbi:uncharacterized protein conserved in bacteria [Hahella chejuensis KCTC 2396]|uniref:Ribosomal RNA small subunit methyltransferase E n=1 Tax=Hahella chejuensis (strain KCTC 2396) TaxID=349521 RepID=Q2SN20_HAHCH|nr:16S rRNA (uracil(1498)-N(3))-methyltransferase [Hahella chejuensis]ABC27954.1 uncharacterized protein conserved in bacteria [Hahella chejuensis KCTC 2396]
MNILLFSAEELSASGQLTLTDRRAEHLRKVLKAQAGDDIRVGQINGEMGTARLLDINDERARLEVNLNVEAPPPLDLTLILALPRPKMMRRVIQSTVSLGVKRIYLINSYKVEKSYWQTPWLEASSLRENVLLGLEQGVDTLLPEIHMRKLFKPFVEDELPGIIAGSDAWVAHPTSEAQSPQVNGPLTLAVGPEGGFTPYEVKKLEEIGFKGFTLGKRILRVETVIPALIGKLYL